MPAMECPSSANVAASADQILKSPKLERVESLEVVYEKESNRGNRLMWNTRHRAGALLSLLSHRTWRFGL